MRAADADRPIGLFDSGVGGLTVLRELRRQLPAESTIYLGDEARMPYGPREPAEVVGFTREAMRWFAGRDCKLVVNVGNMHRDIKGQPTLIKAARIVCAKFPDIRFVLVGDGASRAQEIPWISVAACFMQFFCCW